MIKPDIFVTIQGESFHAAELQELSLKIEEKFHAGNGLRTNELILKNSGADPVEIESIELRFSDDLNSESEAKDYHFYKEGLTAVGVAGTRQGNECDFELDQNFLNFTVSDPPNYSWRNKGMFSGEQVGVISNRQTGKNLLLGFISATRFFCRIKCCLEDEAEKYISAVIDLDGIPLLPHKETRLETLLIAEDKPVETLLNLYAEALADKMGALTAKNIPDGWCSYYYYYGRETESDILENAGFLARNRDKIKVEYIQIDDGWQKSRGNWLETNPEKFPHGMKWLADEIKKLGFKPGIWVAPFLVGADTKVYKQHQEWLLKSHDGKLLTMANNYVLDTTHPEAVVWLTSCFKVMKSWGYSYFKLDFMMVETCHNAKYYEAGVTRLEAYRKGLAAIREAVGDDTFILGGTTLLFPSVGLVDSFRIATDVTPFWSAEQYTPESPAIFNVCRNIINRGYMHGKLWINDPDCLIVRDGKEVLKYQERTALTLQETYMLASAMIMSGGAIFLGDRMELLSQKRIDIIKKVFALRSNTTALPLDRMEKALPQIWLRKGDGNSVDPHLLAVFNFDKEPVLHRISLLDLALNTGVDYQVNDIWTKQPGLSLNDAIEVRLEPHTCKLLSIHKDPA